MNQHFATPELLQKGIDAYFEGLYEEKWEQRGPEKTWHPCLDRNGDVLRYFREQPTITGLALHLKVTKQTLINYQKKDEYEHIISQAKLKIEHYYEIADEHPAVKIFKLKNFNWTDKQEVINSGHVVNEVKTKIDKVDLDSRIENILRERFKNALQ